MKHCWACKKIKDTSLFYKNKNRKDGISSTCKECYKLHFLFTKSEDLRLKDKLYQRERRRQTPGVDTRYYNKYKSLHPERIKSYRMVEIAVKTGLLMKSACQVYNCNERKVQGHHQDYYKPLDIVWLCVKHHKQLHFNTITMKQIVSP